MVSEESINRNGIARLSKYGLGPNSSRSSKPLLIPQHSFHVIGRFLRILSVYILHHFLVQSQAPIVPFTFLCLLASSLIFILIQRPWLGKPLPKSQWTSAILNGAVYASSVVLFAYGLRSVGPIRMLLAEYSGAVVSAFSTLLFGRRRHRLMKLYGILIMLASFFFLSHGWAMGSLVFRNPVLTQDSTAKASEETENVGFLAMVVPISAGLLAALRRLIARFLGRAHAKKRLHTVTVTSSTLFLLPFAVFQMTSGGPWLTGAYQGSSLKVFLMTIVFGTVLVFYVDTFAEDRLRIGPSSLKHLLVTAISVFVLELGFRMDFSPPGFLLLTVLLGVGMHLSTSIEKKKADTLGEVTGRERRQQQGLETLLQAPLEHVFSDSKSTRIALFLLINTAFMVVEFTYGFFSNSLGLISDACHMLFDCAALVIGLYAAYISRMDSPSKFAYGYGRFEVLSGYVNAVFLILVAALIVVESLERILDPPEIATGHLLVVSVGGLLVNMIGLAFFHDAHHHAHSSSCSHSHAHTHAHALDHDPAPLPHQHCPDHNVTLPGGFIEHSLHASCNHDHTDPSHAHPHHDHVDHHHDHHHDHVDHHHDHVDHHHDCVDHHHDHVDHHHDHVDDHHDCVDHHHGHVDQHHDHEHGVDSGSYENDGGGGYLVGVRGEEGDMASACGGHHHGPGQVLVQDSLSSGNPHMDHNMRGIFLHVLADTLGSVGVVISTLLIKYKGWLITDPACSIFISLLIIATVIPLLQNSAEIILQRVPRAAEGIIHSVLTKVENLPGVRGHRLAHFWSFTPKMMVGSLHVEVEKGADKQSVCRRVVELFRSVGVSHVTVQVEDLVPRGSLEATVSPYSPVRSPWSRSLSDFKGFGSPRQPLSPYRIMSLPKGGPVVNS